MAPVIPRQGLASLARRAAPIAAASLVLLAPLRAAEAKSRSSPTLLERSVKAAFLYKFAGYVEWPPRAFANAETPITIGIAGDDRLAAELVRLVEGRTSGNRRVEVSRLEPGDPPEGTHILFVPRSEESRLADWIRAARALPILIVTERDGTLDDGSMINFVMDEGRVRFEISLGNATRSGLQLSSGLLAVAKTVTTGAPSGTP